MRRSLVIATSVVVLAAIVVGTMSLIAPPTIDVFHQGDDDPEYVSIEGSDAEFWPYLSPEMSDEYRVASPLNVVVMADLETTAELMTEDGTFNETPPERQDAEAETFSAEELRVEGGTLTAWGETTGAARYASVSQDEDNRWVSESVQLDHGDYYGVRHHLRLYELSDGEEEIVLIQAHQDHFDWFTLRHAVDGVEDSQRYVEQEFMDAPVDTHVWRTYLGNDGPYDADGWVTVVELALVPLVGLSLASLRRRADVLHPVDRQRLEAATERITLRHFALAGTIVGIVLGVRLGGVLLEWYATFLSMHAIAALLYPFLALGLPVATYAVASGLLRRIDAALVASGALSVAIVLDYTAMGIAVLPLSLVLHRAGLIVALGLIAAGAANRAVQNRRANDLVVAGGLLWSALLAIALLGWL